MDDSKIPSQTVTQLDFTSPKIIASTKVALRPFTIFLSPSIAVGEELQAFFVIESKNNCNQPIIKA
jgi:hypothetical protein